MCFLSAATPALSGGKGVRRSVRNGILHEEQRHDATWSAVAGLSICINHLKSQTPCIRRQWSHGTCVYHSAPGARLVLWCTALRLSLPASLQVVLKTRRSIFQHLGHLVAYILPHQLPRTVLSLCVIPCSHMQAPSINKFLRFQCTR
jgi:hypothetical protein